MIEDIDWNHGGVVGGGEEGGVVVDPEVVL